MMKLQTFISLLEVYFLAMDRSKAGENMNSLSNIKKDLSRKIIFTLVVGLVTSSMFVIAMVKLANLMELYLVQFDYGPSLLVAIYVGVLIVSGLRFFLFLSQY